MVKLVYTLASGASPRKWVGVQVPLRAQNQMQVGLPTVRFKSYSGHKNLLADFQFYKPKLLSINLIGDIIFIVLDRQD